MFAAFLHALPTILGATLCLYALYGFWRGLGMSRHTPEHRAEDGTHWWSGPNN